MDDATKRRERRKATWTGNVLDARDRAAVEAAERAWWAGTTPEQRIAMIEEISADAYGLRGMDLASLRLQRSVTRIRRRAG